MAIDAKTVKKLRDMTGVGMMDCKEALQNTNGDLDKALDYLRKEGKAQAAKKSAKEATEGLITSKLSDKADNGVLLKMKCETDFVARNDNFKKLADDLANLLLQYSNIDDVDKLKELDINSKKVKDTLSDLVLSLGEKIAPAEFYRYTGGLLVDSYIHSNGKVGVLIQIDGEKSALGNPLLHEFAHNIAMHIAATAPLAIKPEDIPEEDIVKEKEIYTEQAAKENKPDHIIPKIVDGKLSKYFQKVSLLEQEYIKDDDLKVKEYLKKTIEELGASLEIKQFIRLEI